ncbi:MAG: hypothetical protein KDD40_05215, partial [Bdellovibrionales bacterium]|nr:hypothetical protein [Bdellovibrionales bacterium]
MASLTQYCIEQKLKGAFLKAIGALEKVELGYYELEQKNYIRK